MPHAIAFAEELVMLWGDEAVRRLAPSCDRHLQLGHELGRRFR